MFADLGTVMDFMARPHNPEDQEQRENQRAEKHVGVAQEQERTTINAIGYIDPNCAFKPNREPAPPAGVYSVSDLAETELTLVGCLD